MKQDVSSWKYFPRSGYWPGQYDFKSVAPPGYYKQQQLQTPNKMIDIPKMSIDNNWRQQQFQQPKIESPKTYYPPPQELFKTQDPMQQYQQRYDQRINEYKQNYQQYQTPNNFQYQQPLPNNFNKR
jgi:hypothetical protein